MKLTFIFGSYVPSYLLIKINTPDSLANIRNLQKADQAVFFHEYTHFLQNITTGFGQAHIWNTYDRLRQIIASQQKNGLTDLQLPVDDKETQNQKLFFKVMRSISGSKYVPENIDDKTCEIQSLKFVRDPSLQLLYPHAKVFFISTQLKDADGNTSEYSFGETAVSETMAYLIETKFYGQSTIDNFPYRGCIKLGEYLGVDIVKNDESLFALCDVAMLSNYPGWMFYQILLDIRDKRITPNAAEDIYDLGIKIMAKHGLDVMREFKKTNTGVIMVLKQLFHQSFFKETVAWLIYILECGYQARLQEPSFMLRLYKDPDYFNGYWQNIIAQFGTPQLYNYTSKRFFNAPLKLKDIEDKIEPIFLLCSQQINNTLLAAKQDCELYKCCKASINGVKVDDRCDTEPWERSKDSMLCAYASLWMSYGLDKKQVVFK